jgi:hypothetical protein
MNYYVLCTTASMHPLPLQDLRGWKLSNDQLETINKRSNDLGGEQNWIPPQVNFIKKTFRLKAVDFVRISRGGISYMFEGIFDGESTPHIKQAFESFTETLRLLLTTHFNTDNQPLSPRTKHRAAKLMEQTTETLSLLETCAPRIIFDRMLHILTHVTTAMTRWNSVRNFWCFPSET